MYLKTKDTVYTTIIDTSVASNPQNESFKEIKAYERIGKLSSPPKTKIKPLWTTVITKKPPSHFPSFSHPGWYYEITKANQQKICFRERIIFSSHLSATKWPDQNQSIRCSVFVTDISKWKICAERVLPAQKNFSRIHDRSSSIWKV